jgi:hypothetical protein
VEELARGNVFDVLSAYVGKYAVLGYRNCLGDVSLFAVDDDEEAISRAYFYVARRLAEEEHDITILSQTLEISEKDIDIARENDARWKSLKPLRLIPENVIPNHYDGRSMLARAGFGSVWCVLYEGEDANEFIPTMYKTLSANNIRNYGPMLVWKDKIMHLCDNVYIMPSSEVDAASDRFGIEILRNHGVSLWVGGS